MPIASLKDLYFDELGDLYDAETQMIRTLPRLVEAARAPELRDCLRRHCDESRLHLERLELIFTHWGERRRAKPCAGLAGIVQEADERLHQAATDDVRDAAIIGIAQRIEHYEIAAYGCARTYARRLNRLDEARLLQETLDDEGRADHRLTEIAEAHINDDARRETDFQAPVVRALTYVSIEDIARRRGSDAVVPVRSAAGDDLGVLDGVILDGDQARYVVVDAGGVMTRRRYLLPIALVRFDEGACGLCANLEKQVAERYPSFDRDEFNVMSNENRRQYEERLLALFPRDGCAQPTTDNVVAALPEWLLAGTWITVPSERADRLPDEAHAFINEFAPVSSDTVDAAHERDEIVAQDREEPAGHRPDEAPPPPDEKIR
jgi:ferritin-like metal-binding protein YciE